MTPFSHTVSLRLALAGGRWTLAVQRGTDSGWENDPRYSTHTYPARFKAVATVKRMSKDFAAHAGMDPAARWHVGTTEHGHEDGSHMLVCGREPDVTVWEDLSPAPGAVVSGAENEPEPETEPEPEPEPVRTVQTGEIRNEGKTGVAVFDFAGETITLPRRAVNPKTIQEVEKVAEREARDRGYNQATVWKRANGAWVARFVHVADFSPELRLRSAILTCTSGTWTIRVRTDNTDELVEDLPSTGADAAKREARAIVESRYGRGGEWRDFGGDYWGMVLDSPDAHEPVPDMPMKTSPPPARKTSPKPSQSAMPPLVSRTVEGGTVRYVIRDKNRRILAEGEGPVQCEATIRAHLESMGHCL